MSKFAEWMSTLRESLHIPLIEANVSALDDALKSVETSLATGQAVFANEQKHHEVILNEIKNTIYQLKMAVESERRQREEIQIQLAAEMAAMRDIMKKMADIVELHIQPTHQGRIE